MLGLLPAPLLEVRPEFGPVGEDALQIRHVVGGVELDERGRLDGLEKLSIDTGGIEGVPVYVFQGPAHLHPHFPDKIGVRGDCLASI